MPEATVNENYRGVAREDDVGLARESSISGTVYRKAEPKTMKQGSHPELRLGILASNPRHDLAAPRTGPFTGFHLSRNGCGSREVNGELSFELLGIP